MLFAFATFLTGFGQFVGILFVIWEMFYFIARLQKKSYSISVCPQSANAASRTNQSGEKENLNPLWSSGHVDA